MSNPREGKGSIIYKLIIVALFGVLVYIIVSPWQEKLKEDALIKESRKRMDYVRAGNMFYINQNGVYAPSIDELVRYVSSNPQFLSKKDSIFSLQGYDFDLSQLKISPVSLSPYEYASNDTSKVKKYLIKDPVAGSIGSIIDEDKVNKATWE